MFLIFLRREPRFQNLLFIHSLLQCHVLFLFFPIFLEPSLAVQLLQRTTPSSNFIKFLFVAFGCLYFLSLRLQNRCLSARHKPLFRLISIGTHAVSPFVECMRAHIIMLKTCLDCRKYEVNKFLPRRRTAND